MVEPRRAVVAKALSLASVVLLGAGMYLAHHGGQPELGRLLLTCAFGMAIAGALVAFTLEPDVIAWWTRTHRVVTTYVRGGWRRLDPALLEWDRAIATNHACAPEWMDALVGAPFSRDRMMSYAQRVLRTRDSRAARYVVQMLSEYSDARAAVLIDRAHRAMVLQQARLEYRAKQWGRVLRRPKLTPADVGRFIAHTHDTATAVVFPPMVGGDRG